MFRCKTHPTAQIFAFGRKDFPNSKVHYCTTCVENKIEEEIGIKQRIISDLTPDYESFKKLSDEGKLDRDKLSLYVSYYESIGFSREFIRDAKKTLEELRGGKELGFPEVGYCLDGSVVGYICPSCGPTEGNKIKIKECDPFFRGTDLKCTQCDSMVLHYPGLEAKPDVEPDQTSNIPSIIP